MLNQLKNSIYTQVEIKTFTVVKEVLRNNYQSRNLIDPYDFWIISPRNFTSFTRPFLGSRCALAGHETSIVLQAIKAGQGL